MRAGVPVYDIPVESLGQQGYLTAWEFQKVEAALVTLPAATAAVISDLFYASVTVSGVEKWFERLFTPSYVAVIPWITFTFARFAGYWSLPPEHRSAERVTRATRAYIYIANSYDFMFELLWAAAVAVYSIAEAVFGQPLPGEGIVFLVLLAYLVAQKIPQRLFLANGYDVDSLSSGESVPSLNLTPGATALDDSDLKTLWRRWRIVNGIVVPALFCLAWLVLAIAATVAAVLIVLFFE
jgi:hypothetical protein